MAMQKVVVTIPLDDTRPVTAEAEGHVGKACVLDLDAIAEVLGGPVEREVKPEYYREPKARERLKTA